MLVYVCVCVCVCVCLLVYNVHEFIDMYIQVTNHFYMHIPEDWLLVTAPRDHSLGSGNTL